MLLIWREPGVAMITSSSGEIGEMFAYELFGIEVRSFVSGFVGLEYCSTCLVRYGVNECFAIFVDPRHLDVRD